MGFDGGTKKWSPGNGDEIPEQNQEGNEERQDQKPKNKRWAWGGANYISDWTESVKMVWLFKQNGKYGTSKDGDQTRRRNKPRTNWNTVVKNLLKGKRHMFSLITILDNTYNIYLLLLLFAITSVGDWSSVSILFYQYFQSIQC